MKKVFLDTNIFIDFLDSNRTHHAQAKELFYFLISNEIQIVLSEDMLSTIAYLLKGEKLNIFIIFIQEIISNENFKIAPFGNFSIIKACNYFMQNKGDFEDYLQYFCALKEECCAIYSRDSNVVQLDIPIKCYGDFNL